MAPGGTKKRATRTAELRVWFPIKINLTHVLICRYIDFIVPLKPRGHRALSALSYRRPSDKAGNLIRPASRSTYCTSLATIDRWTMSKNKKGMICLLSPLECQELSVNHVAPDCRRHLHLSRRRVCELFDDARFADRTLAHVYDAQEHLLGFVVEVAGRVRWCEKLGDEGCKVWIDPVARAVIYDHLDRIQAILSRQQPRFEVIVLPKRRGSRPGVPTRNAVLSETLRSHSPCSLTAKDSELNVEGVLRDRRARDRESR